VPPPALCWFLQGKCESISLPVLVFPACGDALLYRPISVNDALGLPVVKTRKSLDTLELLVCSPHAAKSVVRGS
jgi:hypothetical protein